MEGYRWCAIADVTHLNDQVFTLRFEGDFAAEPGQFYMLKVGRGTDPLLGRPISVSDCDASGITFLIQVMGRGTQMLRDARPGDRIGLLGPLGRGFEPTSGRCALLAGTAGIAPLLLLAKRLPQKPDLYAGFRTESYYTDRFEGYIDRLQIATEDGSEGYKGYALDLLDASRYDKVYICGPMPMILAAIRKFPDAALEVSLEAHMGCGFGACLSCNIETKKGGFRICKDGPVISAKEILR